MRHTRCKCLRQPQLTLQEAVDITSRKEHRPCHLSSIKGTQQPQPEAVTKNITRDRAIVAQEITTPIPVTYHLIPFAVRSGYVSAICISTKNNNNNNQANVHNTPPRGGRETQQSSQATKTQKRVEKVAASTQPVHGASPKQGNQERPFSVSPQNLRLPAADIITVLISGEAVQMEVDKSVSILPIRHICRRLI